jgi:cell division initiation protein
MSPSRVRNATFGTRRRGYDPEEVYEFLHRVATEIESGDTDRSLLRAELSRVTDELAEVRSTAPPQEPDERREISAHAVNLLSQAQQAADNAVAEAERYARDMVLAARNQYQEILQRAQEAASETASELRALPGEYGVPVHEVEYVRTFAHIAQVQLRSVLDALGKEVDRLGRVPQMEATDQENVTWQPVGLPPDED